MMTCLGALISAWFIGFSMILVAVFAAVGVGIVRFPMVRIYSDKFVVIEKSVYPFVNHEQVYRFDEIGKIQFFEGMMNEQKMTELTMVGSGAWGGFSRPDAALISLKNGEKRMIYSFGKKKVFRTAIELMQKKLEGRA